MEQLLLPLVMRYSLVLARLAGVLVASPLLGSKMFPARIRVHAACLIAFIFTVAPGIAVPGDVPQHVGMLFILGLREIAIGAMLGMFIRLISSAAMMGGSLVGIQMGLAAAQAVDPQGGGQVTLIGQVLGFMTLAILFAFNAHHIVIAALYHSFVTAPIGELSLGNGALEQIHLAGANLFKVCIGLAAPVITAVFVTNIGMALVARTMPQMNIFVVGFLLTISIAYFTLALSTGGFVNAVEALQVDLTRRMALTIRGI